MTTYEDITDQAIAWHVRQPELTAEGWLQFTEWLEAAPAHARAFDEVDLGQRLAAKVEVAIPASVMPAPQPIRLAPAPRHQRRWAWAGAATAIAACMTLLLPTVLQQGAAEQVLTTGAGARRTVQLADGTRIEMSGGTTLRVAGDNRTASLDAGEATFHVVHNPAAPFVLRSGQLSVQDVGTVFNVARDGARLDVAVAEGSVIFQPAADAVTLKAGDALAADEARHTVAVSRVAPESVGAWRSGELAFSGQPLAQVADTIHRQYGSELVLEAGLSARPFTGMVRMSGVAEQDIPHIAALIGARWRHDGNRWVLSPAD